LSTSCSPAIERHRAPSAQRDDVPARHVLVSKFGSLSARFQIPLSLNCCSNDARQYGNRQ
jgi:hypothetical protein